MPWFRNTDQYSCVAYLGKDGELFCTVRSGTRYGKTLSTRLVKPTDGPAQIKFKNSFLLGEGALTPGTVLARLGADHAHVFERLTPADRAFYGAESFAADDPPADQAEDGWSEDDASGDVFGGLFPTTVPSLRSAALVSFLRVARYMRESNNLTDRDSLQSTQLLGIREILNEVFDKTMRQTCKSLRQKLETRLRKVHQKRFDNKNHRAATTQMPNASWVREELRRSPPMVSMHYFFATGNMQGGGGNAGNGARGGYARATRTGCCQILERCTELQMSAAHNKVVSSLNNAPSAARELRMDSLGYLCPVSTPEGKRTGLINQRATGASVSRDRSGSIPAVVDMARHFMCDPGADCGARLAGVWISGQFVGCTARPAELAASLRAARRGGQLPRDMGVTRLFDVAVEIRLHSGRMLKPLLPLGEGVTPVESFLASVEHTTWSRLIHAGVLETLDTREEGGAMVCPYDQPSGPRHTHRELFPAAYLGCVAATTPNLDGEPMVRGAYYCNQAAQGLGYDPRNFSKTRLPVKSYGLYYPQKSLVSTSYHRHSGADQRAPVVSNVCIAVMSLQGCEEDAILVNRAAVERGLFRGFMKDTKTVTTADRVPKCFAYDPSGAGSLDPDTGLARVGTVLKKGDPYAGIASAAGVRTLKHNQPLDATVERVMLYNNAEGGFRTAKIVARTNLPLQVGDKLTSRYAQKGVVSRLLAAEEMPWVEGGLEAGGIDIIVNPCFLPSRMTVAQIAEHTFGFAAAVLGLNHVDGTAFSGMMSKVWRQLKAKGFRSNKRWVRDPCTGQRLGRVEIGIASYLRLNKLSSAKMRVRTDGKRDPITGQPVAGKGTGEKALRCKLCGFVRPVALFSPQLTFVLLFSRRHGDDQFAGVGSRGDAGRRVPRAIGRDHRTRLRELREHSHARQGRAV